MKSIGVCVRRKRRSISRSMVIQKRLGSRLLIACVPGPKYTSSDMASRSKTHIAKCRNTKMNRIKEKRV